MCIFVLQQRPISGRGHVIFEVPRSYTHTHTYTHTVWLLRNCDSACCRDLYLRYTQLIQDSQCKRDVNWGTFTQPLLQWKSKKYYIFWVCVCSLRYPACNELALYCRSPIVSDLQWFSTQSHKQLNFQKKKVIERKMCGLIFCTKFVWNKSHSKINWARHDQKLILVLLLSTRYSYRILMNLVFYRQIFEKSSNIKFNEYSSIASQIILYWQTDGEDRQIWQS